MLVEASEHALKSQDNNKVFSGDQGDYRISSPSQLYNFPQNNKTLCYLMLLIEKDYRLNRQNRQFITLQCSEVLKKLLWGKPPSILEVYYNFLSYTSFAGFGPSYDLALLR